MNTLSQRFERCFHHVMAVTAPASIYVEADTCLRNKPLEKLPQKRQVERAHPRLRELHTPHERGSAADVDDDLGQCLIHWNERMRKALNLAGLRKHRGKGLAENQPYVFNEMVSINVEVALRVDLELESSVESHTGEEVIEKWQPGTHHALTGHVWIQSQSNISLTRRTRDLHFARSHVRLSAFTSQL